MPFCLQKLQYSETIEKSASQEFARKQEEAIQPASTTQLPQKRDFIIRADLEATF